MRKVRTGSGATAVQIARTKRGVQTIVEHLGSAHDDAQLAVLVAIARGRIAERNGQEQLDLDALAPASPSRSSGPIMTGSRSRVLWEVLEDAYARLGFETVGNDTFKKLVLARVVEPTSKADTVRVWDELGVPDAPSLSTVWRTLARSVEEDWRSKVAAAAYAHATRTGPLTVVLYDVTTLYFEAEREDKLRRVGMSKERRVDPQILVGLLVDQGGFPLEVHEFAGNKGETLTLLPVLDQFRERHSATQVVVVADADMLSAANLNRLEDAGFGFIVGSRTSSAPYDLAEHYASVGNIVIDGETVDTTRTMGAGVNARERRVVWQYSHKRKIRDNITLNKQLERAEQITAGVRPAKKDRFVTLGTKPGVNWARVEKAREYIGLKGTSLTSPPPPPPRTRSSPPITTGSKSKQRSGWPRPTFAPAPCSRRKRTPSTRTSPSCSQPSQSADTSTPLPATRSGASSARYAPCATSRSASTDTNSPPRHHPTAKPPRSSPSSTRERYALT